MSIAKTDNRRNALRGPTAAALVASWARRLLAQQGHPPLPAPPPMRGPPPQPIPAAAAQPLKVAAVLDVSLADEEAVPAPDPLPRAGGGPAPEDLRALQLINERRRRHGAAPLAWDPQLAAAAGAYAKWCPLGHSGARGLGESMAWWAPRACFEGGAGGGGPRWGVDRAWRIRNKA